jgi:hypothetical protein
LPSESICIHGDLGRFYGFGVHLGRWIMEGGNERIIYTRKTNWGSLRVTILGLEHTDKGPLCLWWSDQITCLYPRVGLPRETSSRLLLLKDLGILLPSQTLTQCSTESFWEQMCVLWGGVSLHIPSNSLVDTCWVPFNSIYFWHFLYNWRNDQIPQAESLVPQVWPLLHYQSQVRGCQLYFWPTSYKWRIPVIPTFSEINVVEWPLELREMLYLSLLVC